MKEVKTVIPVWEVYAIRENPSGDEYEEHICYCREVEKALQRWKASGGFQKGYGVRLALAKSKWIKEIPSWKERLYFEGKQEDGEKKST